MQTKRALIYSLIFFITTEQAWALSAKDMEIAYEKGDYEEAISIGSKLAQQNPNNANIHYYLANSYSRLGRLGEAKNEYSVCMQQTDDARLKEYCQQALAFLSKAPHAEGARPVFNGNRFLLPNRPTRFAPQQLPNSTIDNTDDPQEQIRELRQNFRLARENTPRYVYDDSNRRIINPDYQVTLETLKAQEEEKIRQLRAGRPINTALVNNSVNPDTLTDSRFNAFNPQNQSPLPRILGQVLSSTPPPQHVPIPGTYNNIPGYAKESPYLPQQAYINQLFNAAPLPPPPFPAKLKKEAENNLKQKIN